MTTSYPPLFLDLDGFIADFDLGIYKAFGKCPKDMPDGLMWSLITKQQPHLYRHLPVMADGLKVYQVVKRFGPTFLSGTPTGTLGQMAAVDKHAWVAEVTPGAKLITCLAKDKAKYCTPGAVLVDDRPKYQPAWEAASGVWITHKSAEETLLQLSAIYPIA